MGLPGKCFDLQSTLSGRRRGRPLYIDVEKWGAPVKSPTVPGKISKAWDRCDTGWWEQSKGGMLSVDAVGESAMPRRCSKKEYHADTAKQLFRIEILWARVIYYQLDTGNEPPPLLHRGIGLPVKSGSIVRDRAIVVPGFTKAGPDGFGLVYCEFVYLLAHI